MKSLVVVFLTVFIIVSCNDSESVTDNESTVDDSDITEVTDDVKDEVIELKCVEEWEKVKIIDDVLNMFDFEIVKENGVWDWKKEGEFEKLDYPENVGPIHFFDDGSFIASGLTEIEDGYSFLYYFKADKTVEKYIIKFEKGETLKIDGRDSKYHIFSSVAYDEKSESISAVLFFRTKKGELRPMVLNIDKEGKHSYFSFETKEYQICSFPYSGGPSSLLACTVMDDENNMSSKILTYAIYPDAVYKKTVISGSIAHISDFYFNEDKFYINYYVEEESDVFDELMIVDKDLCSEINVETDYFLTDYFLIKGGVQIYYLNVCKDFSLISGTLSETLFSEDMSYSSLFDLTYVNTGEKEIIFSLGNREEPKENESFFLRYTYTGRTEIVDGSVFKTGSSSYDVEGKGRRWIENEGTENEKILEKAYLEHIDPLTEEVHARHFIYEKMDKYPGQMFVVGENIFYKPFLALSEDEVLGETALFKIPKNWLINEDSKLKEPALKVVVRGLEWENIKEINQLSTGGKHACSINEDDRVICWGDNSDGQMGDAWGEIDDNNEKIIRNNIPRPADLSAVLKEKKPVQISSGYEHSCGVDENGVVFCWGESMHGRLGNGFYAGSFQPIFADISGEMKDKKITTVSAGGNFSCAVDESGVVYCWGLNLNGQLGDGTEIPDREDPMPIDLTGVLKDKKIVEISSGMMHACVIDEEGVVYCWGLNDRGQLGDGEGGEGESVSQFPSLSRIPVKVDAGELKFTYVSAGYSHTCILSEAGKIYCFGDNSNGQLGDGTTEMRLTPVAVDTDKVFKSVSAGFEHTCAIDDKDELYCWGGNPVGQLGTGDKESSPTPVKVKYETDSKIKSVSCGHRHTCSVTTDGIVHCWGWNTSGQLGNGTYEDSLLPKEIKAKE